MIDDETVGTGDDFLGGELTDTVGESIPEVQTQTQTPEAPVTPQAPQTPAAPETPQAPVWDGQQAAGQAFATLQRQHAEQLELTRQQAEAAGAQRALAQFQQAPVQQQEPEIPDPILDPEGFAAWQTQREEGLRHQFSSELTSVKAQMSMSNAQQLAEMTKAQTGIGWDDVTNSAWAEIQRVAPLMGMDPHQLAAQIKSQPDAGQRITQWGMQGRQQSQANPPQDLEAIKRQAGEAAVQAFLAKQGSDPYNLAPPSIGSVPSQAVTSTNRITKGSAEEEALLGS